MPSRPARAWLLLALATLQPACSAGWRRIDPDRPPRISPRQQVQLWSQGQVHRWHAVQWSADSVSGVPYVRPVDCDSCRLSVAQVAVDSIRFGNPTAGFWRTVGAALGIMAAVALLTCNCDTD